MLPTEEHYLDLVRNTKQELTNYEFSKNKILGSQQQATRLVGENYFLHVAAREAYRAYLQTYAESTLFDVKTLFLKKVACCYGLEVPPKVNLK
jgi:ATP-dependent RNA helicase DDX18/HAS1